MEAVARPLRSSSTPARVVITGRAGGVSNPPFASLNLGTHVGDDPAAVMENRRRAVGLVGLGPDRAVFAEQVHGESVTIVDDADAGAGTDRPAIPATDALVTTTPDLALAIMVADCVPGVLVDPVAGVLGVFHAGWKGTIGGVAARTVDVMHQLGAEPDRIVGALGPCMRFETYQVDDVVAAPARAVFGADTAVLTPDTPGHHRFDLHGANLLHLRDAGVDPDGIECSPLGSDDPMLCSHRVGAPVGRFALIAALDARREVEEPR